MDAGKIGWFSLVVEVFLSGFFFLFIIFTNIASGRFGYETFSGLDADVKLQKINSAPKRFKMAFVLIVVEHVGIICLALMLFFAFSPYGMLLAVVWVTSRVMEGLLQIYNKKSYWGLLNKARQYSAASGAEKTAVADSALNVLRTKNSVFTFAQVLFSLGTLSYSILFATSGVVPELIGWFGIVASILYGLGSGIKLVKTDFKALWNVGGLLILIFELILGGWLLFSSLI
jgi:hypothetical protein